MGQTLLHAEGQVAGRKIVDILVLSMRDSYGPLAGFGY